MKHNLMLFFQGTEEAPATGGDADLGMLLEGTSVGPQLQRLSFAYSKCLLCIEGSTAFEYKLAEQAGRLYSMGRHCGISLQYFYTSSQLTTQVLFRTRFCTPPVVIMCAHLYTLQLHAPLSRTIAHCLLPLHVPFEGGSHVQIGINTLRGAGNTHCICE